MKAVDIYGRCIIRCESLAHVTALGSSKSGALAISQTPSITIITLSPPPSHHTSPSKHRHFISATMSADPEREHALEGYKTKLLESREWEAKLKALRLEIKGLQHDFDVSEDNIKALQSVGQIIGEVLKQLDEERCM